MKKLGYIENLTADSKVIGDYTLGANQKVRVVNTPSLFTRSAFYKLTELEIKGEASFYDQSDSLMSRGEFYEYYNSAINNPELLNNKKNVTGRNVFAPIERDYQDRSNTGTTDSNVYTSTIFADTLENNGELLDIKLAGKYAGTLNNKRIKLLFSGITIFDSGSQSINTQNDWNIECCIMKSGNNTARVMSKLNTSSGTLAAYAQQNDLSSIDFSSSIDFDVILKGGADNDATMKMIKINWENF